MRTKHEDQAINTLFELSSKDYELRGEVVPVAVSERGEPVVQVSEVPVPEELAQEPEAEAVSEETEAAEEPPTTPDQSQADQETLH